MKNQELILTYKTLDKELVLFHKYIGNMRDEENNLETFIPNEENVAKAWDKWKNLKNRVDELEELDDVFVLVKNHFKDFLDSLEYALEDASAHPEYCFFRFNWTLDHVSRTSRKSSKEKCEGLVKYLQKVRENHAIAVELSKKKHSEKSLMSISEMMKREISILKDEETKVDAKFPDFSDDEVKALKEAINNHYELLNVLAEEFSGGKTKIDELIVDDLSKTIKMEEDEYRTLLRKKLGVSLDELLSWSKSEMEQTRVGAFEIASKLEIEEDAPKNMKEVNDVLFKYEGPCDSPEEMFRRVDVYLKRTRALAHEYVDLPEDEICICKEVPDCCKDSYPWGGYEGGDFTVRPFHGQMFLNNHNYRNITDGWIKLNALHEAYPGHHVQYVKTAISKTPETVKIGAKLVPILEGTCLRTERAFEFIFGEDPFFPLFVAYRRHHASVRIYVDLMLFYYGKTIEEAVKLYEEELGFTRETARKQVQAHQNMPGYFTCYYYGMKKICEWEEKYNYNKKDFTELLFSAGYISMDRFEELVKLSKGDQERYLKDFCNK